MSSTMPLSDGAVHGSVRLWLRLEGLMTLLLATSLYEARRRFVGRIHGPVLGAGRELCGLPRRASSRRSVLQRGAQATWGR